MAKQRDRRPEPSLVRGTYYSQTLGKPLRGLWIAISGLVTLTVSLLAIGENTKREVGVYCALALLAVLVLAVLTVRQVLREAFAQIGNIRANAGADAFDHTESLKIANAATDLEVARVMAATAQSEAMLRAEIQRLKAAPPEKPVPVLIAAHIHGLISDAINELEIAHLSEGFSVDRLDEWRTKLNWVFLEAFLEPWSGYWRGLLCDPVEPPELPKDLQQFVKKRKPVPTTPDGIAAHILSRLRNELADKDAQIADRQFHDPWRLGATPWKNLSPRS